MIAPRDQVARMAPYVPGRSIETVQQETGRKDLVKLASNESLWGPSPRALEAARASLADVFHYPEVHPPRLTAAIARIHGFSPDEILVGNGGDELLRILAAAYTAPGLRVLYPTPSFSQYAFSAELAGAESVPVRLTADGRMDLLAMLDAVDDRTRLIYLCSPNNPTGGIFSQKAWDEFLGRLPDHVLTVVDQAYGEFADDPAYAVIAPAIRSGRPVAVVRTFSKIYALAGLRVGWMAAPPEVIEMLKRIREPFSVNVVAQSAALAAMLDREYLSQVGSETRSGRERLATELTRRGFSVFPSQANFVTFDTGRDAQAIARAFEREGVIVRPTTSFNMPHHIRVTVGPEWALTRFLSALDRIWSQLPANA